MRRSRPGLLVDSSTLPLREQPRVGSFGHEFRKQRKRGISPVNILRHLMLDNMDDNLVVHYQDNTYYVCVHLQAYTGGVERFDNVGELDTYHGPGHGKTKANAPLFLHQMQAIHEWMNAIVYSEIKRRRKLRSTFVIMWGFNSFINVERTMGGGVGSDRKWSLTYSCKDKLSSGGSQRCSTFGFDGYEISSRASLFFTSTSVRQCISTQLSRVSVG